MRRGPPPHPHVAVRPTLAGVGRDEGEQRLGVAELPGRGEAHRGAVAARRPVRGRPGRGRLRGRVSRHRLGCIGGGRPPAQAEAQQQGHRRRR
ncbi:MAG: hypothetical protein RLN75_05040, partial [Longimicrobiales bacterium]